MEHHKINLGGPNMTDFDEIIYSSSNLKTKIHCSNLQGGKLTIYFVSKKVYSKSLN